MAFNIDYMARVNTSANDKSLKVWVYNGTSTGSNETLATIIASGYFNNFQQVLTSGSEEGPLVVDDVILVHGNDARGWYRISSITTNVALTDLQAGSIETADIEDGAVTTAKLADAAVTSDKLAAAVAGDGLAGGAGTPLSVNVDDSTIETNSDTLRVKALGIDTAQLAADAVENGQLADNAVSLENLDSGITPSHITVFAAEHTTVGGGAAEAITVSGVLATDLVFAQLHTEGTTPRTVLTAVASSDTVTITFSGDPSSDHVVTYQVLRAAA